MAISSRPALACWRGRAFEEFAELDWAAARRCGSTSCAPTPTRTCSRRASRAGSTPRSSASSRRSWPSTPLRERLWQPADHRAVPQRPIGRGAPARDALRRMSSARSSGSIRRRRSASSRRGSSPTTRRCCSHAAAPVRRPTPPRLPAETTQLVGRNDVAQRSSSAACCARSAPDADGSGRRGQDAARAPARRRPLGRVRRRGVRGRARVRARPAARPSPPSRPPSTCSSASTCRSRRRSSSTCAAGRLAARARQLRAPPGHGRTARRPAPRPVPRRHAFSRRAARCSGLPGEQVWRVRPLAIAPRGADAATIADAPAAHLFVERATAADRGFAPEPDDMPRRRRDRPTPRRPAAGDRARRGAACAR